MKLKTDLNAWRRMAESQKRRVKSTATKYVQKKTLEVVTYVLKQTPQLTGTLVQNWTLVVGASNIKDFPSGYQVRNTTWPAGKSPYIEWDERDDGTYKPLTANYEAPRHAGHPDALKDPMRLARLEIAQIRWNSKITLINSAEYAQELTEPGKAMGGGGPGSFLYRIKNVESTQPGMLVGELWNIKTMTIMRFKYLAR